jgi:hypothetical protein
VPTANAPVENVAVNGAVAERAPLPITAVPSRKLTVPVGVPEPGATTATVAVKVTDWPKTDGLTDDVRPVVVLALLTTCDTTALVLPLKLVLPRYWAVIE